MQLFGSYLKGLCTWKFLCELFELHLLEALYSEQVKCILAVLHDGWARGKASFVWNEEKYSRPIYTTCLDMQYIEKTSQNFLSLYVFALLHGISTGAWLKLITLQKLVSHSIAWMLVLQTFFTNVLLLNFKIYL